MVLASFVGLWLIPPQSLALRPICGQWHQKRTAAPWIQALSENRLQVCLPFCAPAVFWRDLSVKTVYGFERILRPVLLQRGTARRKTRREEGLLLRQQLKKE
jgi:hypothetical protein